AIEKRGTGGGGFRKLYAHFLEEAAAFLPAIHENNLVDDAFASAALWTDFAATLKQIFLQDDPSLFKDARGQLLDIYTAEKSIIMKVDEMI
ncbi:MAG: DUF4872 domain-containing protein, partial [Chloroflexota bacterium]